ncbi:MAG: PAS domain-containing protein [Chlorobi bacterium]|nr:PAS domain-containing protein [Chlorobiota bacterium]
MNTEVALQEERKIKIAETHSTFILNSIADGVFTVDENLKITFFNKAAEQITGTAADKAIGQYCFEVLRSNICENGCLIRESISGSKTNLTKQVTILRNDQKLIPVKISASSLKDENGKIIGGVESFRDLSTIESLRKEIEGKYTFEDIISKNHKILDIFSILPNIAESDSAVLIEGPSGSGKELFARALHNLSFRKEKPFIPVNCGALPDALLESELFGYVKGAFTDAKKDKPGKFKLAEGGTIFLDEIDSLSLATQVKLLRVLQEKEFEPLGSTATIKSNVRIISATKNNLLKLVNEDKFRDDLYFRLDVVKLKLPTLAERRDDIPLLVEHFVRKFNHKMDKNIMRVDDAVMEILMVYGFPGNVRELENIIEHAFVMCRDEEILVEHLPVELQQLKYYECKKRKIENPLQKSECKIILEALKRNDWNKEKTAEELEMHRSTLWRKIKKYNLLEEINASALR